MTLRTLNYGNYDIFLIMGNAGFCPSTVFPGPFGPGTQKPETQNPESLDRPGTQTLHNLKIKTIWVAGYRYGLQQGEARLCDDPHDPTSPQSIKVP